MAGKSIAGGVMAAGVLVGTFGGGVAEAQPPDVVGKRYSAAAKALRNSGFRPEVGTMLGADLSAGQCFVVNMVKFTRVNAKGRASQNRVRLDLNCYDSAASNVSPGFSAGNNSPEANAVREADKKAQKAKQKQQAEKVKRNAGR